MVLYCRMPEAVLFIIELYMYCVCWLGYRWACDAPIVSNLLCERKMRVIRSISAYVCEYVNVYGKMAMRVYCCCALRILGPNMVGHGGWECAVMETKFDTIKSDIAPNSFENDRIQFNACI